MFCSNLMNNRNFKAVLYVLSLALSWSLPRPLSRPSPLFSLFSPPSSPDTESLQSEFVRKCCRFIPTDISTQQNFIKNQIWIALSLSIFLRRKSWANFSQNFENNNCEMVKTRKILEIMFFSNSSTSTHTQLWRFQILKKLKKLEC